MAVLVTRPHPDDEATAGALRARGFEVLQAPMLRFEPVPFHDEWMPATAPSSSPAPMRCAAIEPHLAGSRLLKLPLFAVGEHTASAARDAGFSEVIAAKGDAAALARSGAGKREVEATEEGRHAALSGRRRSRARSCRRTRREGFYGRDATTYRMVPAASLPREVCDAFVANRIEAVLHYSRRSARAFLDAARSGGVEISALALPQCCISPAVASILRDAGATQVTAAAKPDENALFEALSRALRSRLA